MSKESESNLNEMMAGDGSGLQLPPAFVMVNPRQHRRYKKGCLLYTSDAADE